MVVRAIIGDTLYKKAIDCAVGRSTRRMLAKAVIPILKNAVYSMRK